jgi:hypothetical protein
LVQEHQDALLLLTFLRAWHAPDNTFMVANGLAERLGWRRERMATARRKLIEFGYIKQLRGGNQFTGAALYRWCPRPKFETAQK